MVSLWRHQPVTVNISRDRAALVREAEDGMLENVYRLQIENTDGQDHQFTISASGLPGIKTLIDGSSKVLVHSSGMEDVGVRLHVDASNAGPGSHPVTFTVTAVDNPKISTDEKSSFIGQ